MQIEPFTRELDIMLRRMYAQDQGSLHCLVCEVIDDLFELNGWAHLKREVTPYNTITWQTIADNLNVDLYKLHRALNISYAPPRQDVQLTVYHTIGLLICNFYKEPQL